MQYIIIDLEWNQPLGDSLFVNEPIRLTGDIIEIGAVKLDEAYQPGEVYRGFVRPEFYSKLHRRVGGLTHINPRDLENAPNFERAWKAFTEWCGEDYCFLVWGTSDMSMIRENLRVRGLPCGLAPVCDLQEVFEDQITRDMRQWSLTDALTMMRIPMETAHDAANDAVNTARLCKCLDLDEGLDYFMDRIPPVWDEFLITDEAGDALEAFECPLCGQRVKPEEKPYYKGYRHAECPECGLMDVTYKTSLLPQGKRRVVRSIRPACEHEED